MKLEIGDVVASVSDKVEETQNWKTFSITSSCNPEKFEDEGDIIFYKNREGKAVCAIHPIVVEEMKKRDPRQGRGEVGDWRPEMSLLVLAIKLKKPRIGKLLP